MLLPHENVLLVFKNIFIRLNRMLSVSSFNQHTNSIGFVTWQTFLWVCFFLPSFPGNSRGGNRSCWWSWFRFSWDWHPNVSALGRAAFWVWARTAQPGSTAQLSAMGGRGCAKCSSLLGPFNRGWNIQQMHVCYEHTQKIHMHLCINFPFVMCPLLAWHNTGHVTTLLFQPPPASIVSLWFYCWHAVTEC